MRRKVLFWLLSPVIFIIAAVLALIKKDIHIEWDLSKSVKQDIWKDYDPDTFRTVKATDDIVSFRGKGYTYTYWF